MRSHARVRGHFLACGRDRPRLTRRDLSHRRPRLRRTQRRPRRPSSLHLRSPRRQLPRPWGRRAARGMCRASIQDLARARLWSGWCRFPPRQFPRLRRRWSLPRLRNPCRCRSPPPMLPSRLRRTCRRTSEEWPRSWRDPSRILIERGFPWVRPNPRLDGSGHGGLSPPPPRDNPPKLKRKSRRSFKPRSRLRCHRYQFTTRSSRSRLGGRHRAGPPPPWPSMRSKPRHPTIAGPWASMRARPPRQRRARQRRREQPSRRLPPS